LDDESGNTFKLRSSALSWRRRNFMSITALTMGPGFCPWAATTQNALPIKYLRKYRMKEKTKHSKIFTKSKS